MTRQIIQLLKEGEGEQVDFKQAITSVQKIAKSIVAFRQYQRRQDPGWDQRQWQGDRGEDG